MAGLGALQSLSENRPRTSEGARRLVSGYLSSNDACEVRGEPVSHLKALRSTARELRDVGLDDENDENAPRFRDARDARGDDAGPEADLETPPQRANATVFRPPLTCRFERKPPPFERPPRPTTAHVPEPASTTTTFADGAAR